MNDKSKNRIIQPLRNYIENVEAMREALVNVPQSEEARKLLTMAKLDMVNAIHKIKWLGFRESEDDNPSTYLIEGSMP